MENLIDAQFEIHPTKKMKLVLFFLAIIGERALAAVIIPRSPRIGLQALANGSTREIRAQEACTCGVKSLARIVNGKVADMNEYPWQVALCYGSPCNMRSQFCGGTVINDQYILTAAHCTEDLTEDDIVVTLGDHDLYSSNESPSQEYEVKKIIMHKGYNRATVRNDIALLKLNRKIEMSDVVSPICLPPKRPGNYAGETAIVTGWGLTSTNGAGSHLLREVELTVITNNECREAWGEGSITKKMMCATEPNKDSCQGDSGGPLIYKNDDGTYEQIGVVSFGEDCASSVYPGVYTRVNKYLRWIARNTKDANYC